MNPEVLLPLIEKLLEDARHIRNRLEIHDGTPAAVEAAGIAVEAAMDLYNIVKDNQ